MRRAAEWWTTRSTPPTRNESDDERAARIGHLAEQDEWPVAADPQPVEVGAVLRAVRAAVDSRRLRLELPHSRWPLPSVLGDPDRLTLAVHRVVLDTLDRSPGEVIVQARQTPMADGIVITVTTQALHDASAGLLEVDARVREVVGEHRGHIDSGPARTDVRLPA